MFVNLYSFLKGQGIFSLDVNKIILLQVTLQPRYAKNVIRYAFMLKGSQSRFRVMKVGRDVTVDDGGNYMSRFMS